MRSLWWVRHGPTHAHGMIGWSDLPADLSDHAALARLAAYLPAGAPVVSSDLGRAVRTADAVQGARLRLPDDPRLREFHFGDWEHRSFAEIEAEDPARARAFYDRPGTTHPPRGESWREVSARVSAAVAALLTEQTARNIIIIAHFGSILTQLQRALGVAAYEAFAQRIEPLSVTRIDFADGIWQAGVVNHRP